jgi:hypothetical protein
MLFCGEENTYALEKALMQDHTISTRKALKENHCNSIMIFQLYTSFEAMQSFRENKNATRIAISITYNPKQREHQ